MNRVDKTKAIRDAKPAGQYSYPFLSLISWNGGGVYHTSQPKRAKKFSKIHSFLDRAPVVFLQETHLPSSRDIHVDRKSRLDVFDSLFAHTTCFHNGLNNVSAGTTIMIADELIRESTLPPVHKIIWKGHLHAVTLQLGRIRLHCVNMYLDSGSDAVKISQIKRLAEFMGKHRGDEYLLAGDLNFLATAEDHWPIRPSIRATLRPDVISAWNDKILTEFFISEIPQSEPTFFHPNRNYASRLDRVYSSIQALDQVNIDIFATLYERTNSYLSDHSPILFVTQQPPNKPNHIKTIPRWIV